MTQPLVVCDGWTEPRHPRVILKDGDSGRVSHGLCYDCELALFNERLCDFCGKIHDSTFACPRCGWKVTA